MARLHSRPESLLKMSRTFTASDGVPFHSVIHVDAGSLMSRSPSSWAMPTNVLATDFVMEKTFCVVWAFVPRKYHSPAILPSRTTTRQFDFPGLGRRRDLLQRGRVEADGLGRDDVPVRTGDGRARRGGRRRRRARRSGAGRAVVVAGARRTDDERDDGREREGCRPTTRTADHAPTLTVAGGDRIVTRELTGSDSIVTSW